MQILWMASSSSKAWMSEEKPSLTSALSGERYFYLWPRFSIKYWRWMSKDSLDDIKAEWWLCWSWKWHSAVWRGMSSTFCCRCCCFCFAYKVFRSRVQPLLWIELIYSIALILKHKSSYLNIHECPLYKEGRGMSMDNSEHLGNQFRIIHWVIKIIK